MTDTADSVATAEVSTPQLPDSLRGPLVRYRVAAWVVGCILVTLIFVAMPLKYLADQPLLVETIGPFHGFAYMVYLVLVYLLSSAAGWSWKRTLGVMLAGTIPLLSFWVEHQVTRSLRQGK